jgi:hypothetical protein
VPWRFLRFTTVHYTDTLYIISIALLRNKPYGIFFQSFLFIRTIIERTALHFQLAISGVDTKGNLSTDIHINPWVAIPFLTYVLYGKGVPVSGKCVSFRELKHGVAIAFTNDHHNPQKDRTLYLDKNSIKEDK